MSPDGLPVAVAGGDAVITMMASPDVSGCSPPHFISVRIEYQGTDFFSDCNVDGVPDDCQHFGDMDGDDRVSLNDYAAWRRTMTGPVANDSPGACRITDADLDGDVDLADFVVLQMRFGESK